MAELKPETKIERLIEKMKPLATWYAQNKPDVRIIRITPDELKLLRDNPQPALQCGIFVKDAGVKWGAFELKTP